MMYKQYNDIDDFIADEKFKEWVKFPTIENEEYWINWLEVNKESKHLLEQARVIIHGIKFQNPDPTDLKEDAILENILKASPRIRQKKTIFWSKMKNVWKVAAVLIIGFSIAYYYYQSIKTPINREELLVVKENPSGIKSRVGLPDGTIVWLNAESTLSYEKSFSKQTRAVKLTGEAYFEVSKNAKRPFFVLAEGIEVRALGTAFNINTFDTDQIEVYLTEGKVKVTNDKATNAVTLLPGEMILATPSSGTLIKKTFVIDEAVAWTKGIIVFKQANFEEVTQVLSRWYGVEFKIINEHKINDWSYSSKFKNKSLEQVLDIISQNERFEFDIEERLVTLTFR